MVSPRRPERALEIAELPHEPRRDCKARAVEMRFLGGLTVEESAQALGVSVDTVMRDWKLAKAWPLRELRRPFERREA